MINNCSTSTQTQIPTRLHTVYIPTHRSDYPGHSYAFGVMIVVNFVLFLLIAAGQASIFLSIRTTSLIPSDSGCRKSQDLDIARRLITIAVSDFLCRFPIGLLGLLAWRGVAVPDEVGVGVAIFVMPLNSAINPFIYTVNVVLERANRRRDQRIRKLVEKEVKDNSGN